MGEIELLAAKLTPAERQILLTQRGYKRDFWPLLRLGLFTYEPVYHAMGGAAARVGYKADYTEKGLAVRAILAASITRTTGDGNG